MKSLVKIYLIFMLFSVPLYAYAAQDVAGTVSSVRGRSNILRLEKTLEAKVRDNIMRVDTVETLIQSRIKLLFTDDSLITLGENSRLIVKEYLEAPKDKRGRSIYSLLDGKMRAIVGRTNMEIHTPTAVAAARGTHFIIWIERIKYLVTCVSVADGEVGLRSVLDTVPGSVTVTAGNKSCVKEGEPPTEPVNTPSDQFGLLLDHTTLEDILDVTLPPPISTAGIPSPGLVKIRLKYPFFNFGYGIPLFPFSASQDDSYGFPKWSLVIIRFDIK